jgi:PKHD-type hydroxylase
MLLNIPAVLTDANLVRACELLSKAEWIDGRKTAGYRSTHVKNDAQLAEDDPAAEELGETIVDSLQRHPLFISAALPLRVFPPLFNRYETDQNCGNHVDNAIRQAGNSTYRVRTDISATLFLNPPDEYDGGELVVEDTYGVHGVKLPAGDLILYPAGSLHRVMPVTRGSRFAAFFWIQSMVRDDGARTMLFDLDTAIQQLVRDVPSHPGILQLTGVYHNLLRRWADV